MSQRKPLGWLAWGLLCLWVSAYRHLSQSIMPIGSVAHRCCLCSSLSALPAVANRCISQLATRIAEDRPANASSTDTPIVTATFLAASLICWCR
jgi:hypothetical protein